MTSYAVIGSGAIGGFYGARLAKAGRDVHFMFRQDAEYVREKGLVVNSPDGDFTLHPISTHSDWDTFPPVDVVIVAVKAMANAEVAPRIQSIIKPGGTVLLIQNGLGAEPRFAEELGPEITIVGATALIASQRTGPNEISHFDFGLITLAQYTPGYTAAGITDEMRSIEADLLAGGVPVALHDDLLAGRWQKLLWNIPFNALSVVLRATTEELVGDPAIEELVSTVMHEVRAAAAADGRDIPSEMVELMITGTKYMKPYSTSMKVDFDAGRPLELDALFGEPLRRASANGVAMPATDVLYHQLQFINARL